VTEAFEVGERIRYRHEGDTSSWRGRTGVVTGYQGSCITVVRWDGGGTGYPDTKNLERDVDWTLPIELSDGTPLIADDRGEEHHVQIMLSAPGFHPAFPGSKFGIGSARRHGGLVISNHKFYVRNRIPKIMPHLIDTTKPLEAVPNIGVPMTVTFVTETSDDKILVTSGTSWLIFDKHGEFVRSSGGQGSALKLRNKPVATCGYRAVWRDGTISPTLYGNRALAWDSNPACDHLVQIDKTDGVVTGVGVLKRKP